MNTLPASGQHNVAVVRVETTGNCGLRFRHSHTLCHRGINKNESHTLNDSAHATPNVAVVLTHIDFWFSHSRVNWPEVGNVIDLSTPSTIQ